LKGRAILVTGATQGIGLAIAAGAARKGAESVVIVGRDSRKAPSAITAVERAGAPCAFVEADLEQPHAPDAIFDFAAQRFGRVDALVNSAATTDRGALVDADLALWDRLFAVNARAPFFLMQTSSTIYAAAARQARSSTSSRCTRTAVRLRSPSTPRPRPRSPP
jgi:NAD(P)-dependent dehydrogenase (short-subunit alcohol dehydrogenase family)